MKNDGSPNTTNTFVDTSAKVGVNTTVNIFAVILANARIGDECIIGTNCYIAKNSVIGNRVKIGPHVIFSDFDTASIVVEDDVTIEAGVTISSGVTLSKGCVIKAGSIVTNSVPPYAIANGAPAHITGYTNQKFIEFDSITKVDVEANSGESNKIETPLKNVYIQRFKTVKDMRGNLSVGNFTDEIPFIAKRYFLVYAVPSMETRGAHAHFECHQFLICVKGSCSVVADNGQNRCEVLLDDPSKGLYLPPLTWGIQYKYSTDAVLLVFASHEYEASDYIRDYNQFVQITKSK